MSQAATKKSVIDWEIGTELAGGNRDLAEEFLGLFCKDLAENLPTIEQNYKNNNFTELTKLVHKIHGGASYCGIPRLKESLKNLETVLKSGQDQYVAEYYQTLITEAKAVLTAVNTIK